MRMINGKVCDTYKEACSELGLFTDDEEWYFCILEACQTCTYIPRICELFVVILNDCVIANGKKLWEKYKKEMSEDILRKLQNDKNIYADIQTEAENRALYDIQLRLEHLNKSLAEFDISNPPVPVQAICVNKLIQKARDYDHKKCGEIAQSNYNNMNVEQKAAFDLYT